MAPSKSRARRNAKKADNGDQQDSVSTASGVLARAHPTSTSNVRTAYKPVGHPDHEHTAPSWTSGLHPDPTTLHQRLADTTRFTAAHCFFHSGPLSNWYSRGAPFSGQVAIDTALPLLRKAGVRHPPVEAVSTQLISRHWFNCREQFMMACKAWLMEKEIGSEDTGSVPDGLEGFLRTRELMYVASPNRLRMGERGKALWDSSLCQILRTSSPKEQKDLGKRVANWDEELWNSACMAVVTAACYARAAFNPILREAYLDNQYGKRSFVEGAPRDAIWGVGIGWQNPVINNPKHWKGENRLGRCHDEACKMVLAEIRKAREGEENP